MSTIKGTGGPRAPQEVGGVDATAASTAAAGNNKISPQRFHELAREAGGDRQQFAALICQEMGLTGNAAKDATAQICTALEGDVNFSRQSYDSALRTA